MRRVLSFDVGLRNLGAAVVRSRPDWVFARTYVTPDETADAFKTRAFVDFLSHGWELERWRVFDVTEVLERPDGVKNVKRLNLVTKTTALTNTLTQLRRNGFLTTTRLTLLLPKCSTTATRKCEPSEWLS